MRRALGLFGRAGFAKAGKKQQDLALKEAQRREANVPTEITFEDVEPRLAAIATGFAERARALIVGRLDPEQLAERQVSAYGQSTPLRQLSQITPLSPASVQITPFDASLLPGLAREFEADASQPLDLTLAENRLILTVSAQDLREARQQACRRLREQAEQAKQRLRDARRDKLDQLRRFEKFLAADVSRAAAKELDRLCAQRTEEVDAALRAKERQLLAKA